MRAALRSLLLSAAVSPILAFANPTTQPVNLATQKTLYVVGYAHLDTQWRWAYPQVIREFIPNTLHKNFELFEKHPNYVFNFSGARRYEMMKEYYPEDYAKLKQYIAAGRWFVCGSSADENDALVPSAESQIRHILYGNEFARKEFGKESNEFMLPDCFGFPASLPSVLAHCGIRGFSTQKLTWGSANGIPFKIGVWEGTDGQGVIAALDPGGYGSSVREDLSLNSSWLTRVHHTGEISGVFADYKYYGTGDRGGAPTDESVDWIEKSLKGTGPLTVISATAEQMFLDITNAQREKLPHYRGELLLTEHSAGSATSEAYMKRWNRKNELLADSAERASSIAMAIGGETYPQKQIYDAWMLVLGSQMHDMLPGTSLPKAYEYCWNDEVIALNQFASAAEHGIATLAEQLDTSGAGLPLVVYNPLSIDREDLVELTINTPEKTGEMIAVSPDGSSTPVQMLRSENGKTTLIFAAKVPSVGAAIYHLRTSDKPGSSTNQANSSANTIENDRFKVTVDDHGDIASIIDKQSGRECLASPIKLAFLYERPMNYPAWNMDWKDREQPPRSFVGGTPKIQVIESGPVRTTIEVIRESEGSKFVQQIRLANGIVGDRIEVKNIVDWHTPERSLKATFNLAAANPMATYDVQVGTVQRGNNEPKKYEVPQ